MPAVRESLPAPVERVCAQMKEAAATLREALLGVLPPGSRVEVDEYGDIKIEDVLWQPNLDLEDALRACLPEGYEVSVDGSGYDAPILIRCGAWRGKFYRAADLFQFVSIGIGDRIAGYPEDWPTAEEVGVETTQTALKRAGITQYRATDQKNGHTTVYIVLREDADRLNAPLKKKGGA